MKPKSKCNWPYNPYYDNRRNDLIPDSRIFVELFCQWLRGMKIHAMYRGDGFAPIDRSVSFICKTVAPTAFDCEHKTMRVIEHGMTQTEFYACYNKYKRMLEIEDIPRKWG